MLRRTVRILLLFEHGLRKRERAREMEKSYPGKEPEAAAVAAAAEKLLP